MRIDDDFSQEAPSLDVPALLALKRYEVPPPGYFSTFAAKVIARIEAGDPLTELSWWRRLLLILAARPSLASGFALIVGLSILGAIGVAPAVQSGSLERDLMLGSAPVAIQAAVREWALDTVPFRGEQPVYAEASSVAPVLGRRADPLGSYATQLAAYPGVK